jgi:alkane 1-monooxygenase
LHDRVWLLTALSFVLAALSFAVSGRAGIVLFSIQALMAVLLLETVNYIEHYGLSRKKGERVNTSHSWDNDAWLSNAFLFNLQRHADHHAHPERPYEALRPTASSPQLPCGYSALVVLALCPPLWRAVMHPRLARYAASAA